MVGKVTDITKAEGEAVNPQPNVSTPAAQPIDCRFYDKLLIFPPLSDAKKFEPWKKYLFTGIVSLAAVAAPLQSTMLMRMYFLIRPISNSQFRPR
jgi:hypothetical protein